MLVPFLDLVERLFPELPREGGGARFLEFFDASFHFFHLGKLHFFPRTRAFLLAVPLFRATTEMVFPSVTHKVRI